VNNELFASHHRAWEEFLRFRTVIGVAVGPKVTRGQVVAREAIVVLVSRKLPRRDVPKGELIPPAFGGFPTDVREPVLMILPEREEKGRERPGDWCHTDVQWIDWIKVHAMNVAQQRERDAGPTVRQSSPRRSRGPSDH
jgi:hypothetical protein